MVEELLFGCDWWLFEVIFKIVGIVISELIGVKISFCLFISFLIFITVENGIDVLFLFVSLFLFDMVWLVFEIGFFILIDGYFSYCLYSII